MDEEEEWEEEPKEAFRSDCTTGMAAAFFRQEESS